ncbi:MAG: DUF3179 domain-containing protein [Dongiaceae bacterium]
MGWLVVNLVWRGVLPLALFGLAATLAAADDAAVPLVWLGEWPNTDFGTHAVDLAEIRSGGPRKDGIPAIDQPQFKPVGEIGDIAATEPVISLALGGEARAYPLRVLTWHEIANDTVAGVPVAVTYCPLCNAAIVFDRRLGRRVLDFGTTGKLRNSDLVMYDRQTESWWQQYSGTAIVGEMTGAKLAMIPARVESFRRFTARHPDGRVLVPSDPSARPYGANPYAGYDGAGVPFLYDGSYPDGIAPMAYVVVVGDEAWTLDLMRQRGRIESGDLILVWEAGQSSALDAATIAEGRDIGNVIVQRRVGGELAEAVHHVTFAFVFHAFQPDGVIHR